MLFKRDKRNVSLTPAGTYLQNEGYRLIKHRDTLVATLAEMGNTVRGTITIGCIGSSVVPALIRKVDAEFPGITTQLVEDTTQNLLNALLDGRIDVMFSRPIKALPHVASVVVHRENTLLAVAPDSRWSIHRHSTVGELAKVPFLLFPREAGAAFQDQIVLACAQHGFAPRIKHESIHAPFLLRLVEEDLGVSIVPRSLSESYRFRVEYLDMPDLRIPLDLVASYRTDGESGPIQKLLAMIRPGAS